MAFTYRLSAFIVLSLALHLGAAHAKTYSDVPAFLKATPQFSKLRTLLIKAKLLDQFTSKAVVTIFAPNNDAFSGSVYAYLDKLSVDELSNALKYHVVPELFTSGCLKTGVVLKTLKFVNPARGTLIADRDAVVGSTLIRGLYSAAKILKAPVSTGNSLVYEIGTVLLEENPIATKYSTVEEALQKLKLKVFAASVAKYKPDNELLSISGILTSAFSQGTVFAITDKAFAAYVKKYGPCRDNFRLPNDGFTAYAFSFEYLPLPRLVSGMTINTLNHYEEELGVGPAQQLQVDYRKGKLHIKSQPERNSEGFFVANVVDSVLVGNSVALHIIDNVLYPLNGSEDDC